MKNKWILLVLGFALLFIVATAAYENLKDDYEPDSIVVDDEEAETEDEPEQVKAPDFTVYDLEGNEVKFSELVGKPIVLNFWASWCGPCKSEMPDFQKVYEEYKDEIQFVMVNLTDGSDETVEKASAFVEEHGYTFPVYYDTKLEAAYAYGVNSVPRTYFIDKEGNLVLQAQGMLSAEKLISGFPYIQ